MVTVRRTALAVPLAAIVGIVSAAALADGISDNVVKIGVLTDMSGQFSHESGEGAVTAVRSRSSDVGSALQLRRCSCVWMASAKSAWTS